MVFDVELTVVALRLSARSQHTERTGSCSAQFRYGFFDREHWSIAVVAYWLRHEQSYLGPLPVWRSDLVESPSMKSFRRSDTVIWQAQHRRVHVSRCPCSPRREREKAFVRKSCHRKCCSFSATIRPQAQQCARIGANGIVARITLIPSFNRTLRILNQFAPCVY